jgi:predicted transcriptional regulator
MREDPFTSNISSEEIDYFVNMEDIVESIIYDVGVASRGISITTLLVGPAGSGKTSILQYVKAVLDKLKQQHPNEYSLIGELHPSYSLFEKAEGSDEENVQLWVKTSKESRDYLFIDDAKPAHIRTIMREFLTTKFKVFAISPLEYEDVYSSLSIAPKTLFLHQLDFNAVGLILDKRIRRALMDQTSEITILDLFEDEALKIIHKYGMGVPGLILKCASKSLNLLQDTYSHGVPLNLEKQKVTSDMAIRACKITECLQALTEFGNLGRTKMEVLEQILKIGRTPTEISSVLKKDRTTISRHLNELREMGLVEFVTRGRESVYEATEPTKVRIEIESMPKGEWNLAST